MIVRNRGVAGLGRLEMVRESPASDEPMAADALDGDVYVSTGKGGDLFLTPQAALASLEPLRAAAEKALEEGASLLRHQEATPVLGKARPRRRP